MGGSMSLLTWKHSSVYDRYELTRKLGKGYSATVYSVSDIQKKFQEGELVVKVVDSTLADPKNEFQILLKVSKSKHCVKVVDYFFDDSFGYIVMERCEIEFYDFLRSKKKLNERSFVPLGRDMIDALAAIHDLQIIHCDIKPDNFLFHLGSRMLKLCDFGMSKCLTPKKCFAVGASGKSAFQSPEMLAGVPYGVQTDMWSVGILLYAIQLGEYPYMPIEPDDTAMRNMIIVGFPVPSFRPASAIESPSAMSVSLLRSLIDRDPLTRVKAKEALNHAWFTVSGTSGHCSHSMMPAIHSARSVSAFSLTHKDALSEDIDPRLMMLRRLSRRSSDFVQNEVELKFSENFSHTSSSTDVGSERSEPYSYSPSTLRPIRRGKFKVTFI